MRPAGRRARTRKTVLGFVALIAGCAASPEALPPPQSQQLVLHPYAGRLRFIETTSPPGARLLFDTGGGFTLLAPDVADSLHCVAYSSVSALRMSGERFDLDACGPVTLQFGPLTVHPDAAVFDLMKLLPEGLPHVDGLASLENFDGHRVTLDLSRGLVEITESSPIRELRDMKPIAIRIARPFAGAGLDVFARVSGARGPLWFEIDSGNLDPVIISRRVIDQLGLATDQVRALQEGSTADVSLSLDGLGPVPVAARAGDIVYDGVLSAEYLEQLILVLDLGHSLGWAGLNTR
jgi:hypothetical protein